MIISEILISSFIGTFAAVIVVLAPVIIYGKRKLSAIKNSFSIFGDPKND